MHARFNGAINVPDIWGAACASRRTLQYCFEAFLHTTPLAYLRAQRLNEARHALKRDPGARIMSVASTVGFNSPSHFTHHDRLMFGERPSATLRLSCDGSRLQL